MSSLLSTTWKMPAYLLVFVVLSLFVLVASANETLSQAQVSPLDQDHFISLVSVSSQGDQGTGFSIVPTISADGKMVAFNSFAPNLVANDTNLKQDVFVHDLQTGQTTRSSVSSQGVRSRRPQLKRQY